MYNQTTADFYHHLDRLKPQDRTRFLHGVYKQLAVSNKGHQANGEFRRGLENISSDEIGWGITSKEESLFHVVHALNQHGLNNHAKRLMKQYGLDEQRYEGFKGAYERFRHTLSELKKINPELKKGIELFVDTYDEGVKIDVGGYPDNIHVGNPFSANISFDKGSEGSKEKRFEIYPLFNGKRLDQLFGKGHDSVVDLRLEGALSLAMAAVKKDPVEFRKAYEMGLRERSNYLGL